jgi:regulatory protein
VKRPPPHRSLKARAIQYLAQREHSRVELQRKLLPHAEAEWAAASAAPAESGEAGSPEAPEETLPTARQHVEDVLDWLEARQYLSTERFVESRLHARSPRYGNLRIRQELAQHAVALPPEWAESLRDSEFARAWAVWARRFFGKAAAGSAVGGGGGQSVDGLAAEFHPDATEPAGAPPFRRDRSRSGAAAALARQSRFLAGRGFSPEVIRRVLKRAAQPGDVDDERIDDAEPVPRT